MIAERLALALLIWSAVTAYLVVRRRYTGPNLGLVIVGLAAYLVALALSDQPEAARVTGALVSLSALGGGLVVRGLERGRRRP